MGINDIKLFTKLFSGFLIVSLIFICFGIFMLANLEKLNKISENTASRVLITEKVEQLQAELYNAQRFQMEILYAPDLQSLEEYKKESDDIIENFIKSSSDLIGMLAIEANKQKVYDARQSYEEKFVTAINKQYDLKKEIFLGKKYSIDELLEAEEISDKAVTDTFNILEEAAVGIKKVTEQNMLDAKSSAKKAYLLGIIIMAISVVVSLGIAYYLTKSITTPLKNIENVASKIAEGNLAVDVENKTANRKDEIGVLGQSFRKMTENFKQMVSSISQNSQSSASSAEELSASSEEVNASIEQISSSVQEIAKGGQVLSKTILSTKSETEGLIQMVNSVSQSAANVSKNAIASNEVAKKGSIAAGNASKKIEGIKLTVNEASERVVSLGVKTQNINKVIKVINTISDQTNLLALNAAIEAARAGDAGRGFAVVADEVRKLAEETQNATKQIEVMITDIIEETNGVVVSMQKGKAEVSDGSVVISDALSSLELLSKNIEDLSAQVEMISASTAIQLESSKKVQKSMDEITSVAEESAAGSEEASASIEEITTAMQQVAQSSQKLAASSADLNNMVKQFKF